jgi:hypothetical protein
MRELLKRVVVRLPAIGRSKKSSQAKGDLAGKKYPIAGHTIQISDLAWVSLNALRGISSSSEHDTKRMRRTKDTNLDYPMTGDGIASSRTG